MERAVIFDIDDTLVRTSENAYRKDMLVSSRLGMPIVSREQFFSVYGKYTVEQCIAIIHPTISFNDYLQAYNIATKEIPYEPIGEPDGLVTSLQKQNIGVGVLTNGSEQKTEKKLNICGITNDIRQRLLFIFHEGNLVVTKPNPRCFDQAIQIINPNKTSIVPINYIGDCIDDYEASKGAGLDFVGVLSGFTSREEFIRMGVSTRNLIGSIMDLPKYLSL